MYNLSSPFLGIHFVPARKSTPREKGGIGRPSEKQEYVGISVTSLNNKRKNSKLRKKL